jgi:glycosyltransferase involved in cell wall biosynthesis
MTDEAAGRSRRLTVVQMLPALEGGGVERGTLEIGRALVQHGHRSLVISTGGRLVDQLTREGSEHLIWSIAKGSHLLALRYIPTLRRLLRQERVDILHVRSRHPAWVAWLAWRGMPPGERPRFVTTIHGLYSVNWYSAVMARGEWIIAISDTVRSYLLGHYARLVRPERVETIYRGVDESFLQPGFVPDPEWQARWAAEYPQLVGRPVVTLPGRLTRLKGHHDFLQIVERLRRDLPDVCGLIVGGVDPRRSGYARELAREVDRRGLSEAVFFTGHRQDIREVLAVSSVVFSLSTNPPEAFGRTVAEALSLGRPVVGYAHAGVGEILHALFPAGAVPPGDVAAAARVARDLLTGPPAAIRPNDLFTTRRMVDQTLALYHRITD